MIILKLFPSTYIFSYVGTYLFSKEEKNMKKIMMSQPFSLQRIENLGSLQHKDMKGTVF